MDVAHLPVVVPIVQPVSTGHDPKSEDRFNPLFSLDCPSTPYSMPRLPLYLPVLSLDVVALPERVTVAPVHVEHEALTSNRLFRVREVQLT